MKKILLTLILAMSLGISLSFAYSGGDDKIEGKNFSFTLPYPNPANEQVVIYCNLDASVQGAEIVMHNMLGATVLRKEIAAGSNVIELNLESLNPGVYFYSLNIHSQSQFTRRLIIKR